MRMTCLLFVAALAFAAGPERYRILPSPENRLLLEVDKTGLMKGRTHQFLFTKYRGDMRFDPEKPERSHVRLVIESVSAALQDQWPSVKDRVKIREYALKEMLAADRYPEIVFESDEIQPNGSGRFNVHGRLAIRDVTKPVTVSVERKAGMSFEGAAEIRITDYGLKPPTAALGMVGTKDVMRLRFVLTPVAAKD